MKKYREEKIFFFNKKILNRDLESLFNEILLYL